MKTQDTKRIINGDIDSLADGDVVDVEYITGETAEPKVSERLTSDLEYASQRFPILGTLNVDDPKDPRNKKALP